MNQPATVATFENPLGYASAPVELQFQGQQKDVFLTLSSTSTISGRVLNWDRQTPIFGALVHLDGGAASLGSFPTAADGSFTISGVAADSAIRVIAEYSIDGIYRTGSVDAHTPPHGGPVSNIVVILQEQASVDGTIVDGNGAPVPLARYWARVSAARSAAHQHHSGADERQAHARADRNARRARLPARRCRSAGRRRAAGRRRCDAGRRNLLPRRVAGLGSGLTSRKCSRARCHLHRAATVEVRRAAIAPSLHPPKLGVVPFATQW